jgi:hypothetical protein
LPVHSETENTMSDDPTATDPTQTTDPAATVDPDPAAEVEKWKALSKKNEARAKENAAAAVRLAELEEAGKTEAQKAADRIAKAEAEVAAVPARVAEGLRDALVTLGVVPEDRKILLTATEPVALLEQVKAIQGLDTDRKKNGNRAPLQGQTKSSTSATTADEREFVNQLFGSVE